MPFLGPFKVIYNFLLRTCECVVVNEVALAGKSVKSPIVDSLGGGFSDTEFLFRVRFLNFKFESPSDATLKAETEREVGVYE